MRNHGWHLPYHPLQIVAVAVFSALGFSFYVFFVPFVGSSVLKYHVIAAFSPLVFAVFVLYIRCAAIDPADSGIRRAKESAAATRKLESSADTLLQESARGRDAAGSLDTEISRDLQLVSVPEGRSLQRTGNFLRCLCCPFVAVWRCIPGTGLFCGRRTEQETYIPEEDLLFCSLCEAEILKSSKHCRACDKCVDGFDHHCRWLNNCIGKRNYKTFVAVMIASLLMLVTEWGIGIFVLVRCFTEKHKFEKEIHQKLGSSFTRTPFVVVVTLCTFLAMLAMLPLTQLLFFHLILIKKGITTYDYIVAIRDQETQEPPTETHVGRSPSTSPASSVGTAVSAGSSAGALHRAVWCTPPHMFVENQSNMKDEVVLQYSTSLRSASPGMDLENGGGNSAGHLKDTASLQPKRQIGLSPWKLARLSSKEASKAALRAREKSSILRPVKGSVVTETEDSSFESSVEVSTATGGHKVGWRLEIPFPGDRHVGGNDHQNPLYNVSLPTNLCSGRHGHLMEERSVNAMFPLRSEARSPFRPGRHVQHIEDSRGHSIFPLRSEARSPFRSRSLNTATSYPLTASAVESPDNQGSPDLISGDVQLYQTSNQERSWISRATSDGYDASGGESADEGSDHGHRLSQAWNKLKLNSPFIGRGGGVQTATVRWTNGIDDAATSQSLPDSRDSSANEMRSNGSRVEANILKHVKREWPGIRDKISNSTDGSDNSSPSHFASPQPRLSPDIQNAIEINFSRRVDKSSGISSGVTYYEAPSPYAVGSAKPLAGKRGFPSTKRVKDSLLSYRRSLSSSYSGGGLLSSSP